MVSISFSLKRSTVSLYSKVFSRESDHLLYVVMSAFCYAGSFFWTPYMWWTIGLYLFPLFYGVMRGVHFSFKDGFLWGLIVYGFHFIYLGILLYDNAHTFIWMSGYFLLVSYFSCLSGLWFWLSKKIGNTIWSWSFITFLHWYFIQYYSLWIVGRAEGYPFLTPILVLSEKPFLIQWIHALGESLLMVLFIVGMIFSVKACQKGRGLILSIVVVFFPLANHLIHVKGKPKHDELYSKIGYVNPTQASLHKWDTIQSFVQNIEEAKENESIELLIAPESMCKFPLNKFPAMVDSLAAATGNKTLVFGGHKKEAGGIKNSFYQVGEGLIRIPYDKHHYIPFVEEVPYPWNKISFFKNFLLTKSEPFNRTFQERVPIYLANHECLPMICSDLFFSKEKLKNNIPVVVLVNDSWFLKSPYFQHLLKLTARLKSIEWQCPIVYVAHSGGWWLDESGNARELKGSNSSTF